MDLLHGCEILVGTYEAFVMGLAPVKPSTLAASFTDHAHAGSVRSIAAAGKYVVSGSTDEIVKVFNLRARAHHGDLVHHNDTINALAFFGRHHLFTAADDGSIW